MKFTGALSTLLVVLPCLVLETSAAPFNFGNGNGFFGKDRNGKNKGQKGQNGAAGAANSTATAANSTASAGAAAGTSNAGAANGTAAAGAGGDPQTSLTLDPSVIGANIAQNGLNGAGSVAGQAPSATSKNNFINSCIGKTITNGLQIQAGSCNPIPMGDLPAKTTQPSAKFQSPVNMQNFGANTAFTVSMAISNLETGAFVNPNTNYFGAPQALNAQGQIVGHSHFVIQTIPSITSTQAPDPNVFAFFQGLNGKATNGVLSATVTKGLPDGTYRLFSINTAANHQPVVGPVAQHGSFDDAVYFTVGSAAATAAQAAIGAAASNGTPPASNATAAAPAAAPPAAPPAAANATAAGGANAAPPAAPPAAANATAAGGANAAAAVGAGQAKAKGGRRSFMIARQN